MKTLLAGRSLLMLAAFAVAHMAQAQFQAPTQEELKMTADPKAPGAAAVYLYREETTDDCIHYHSYYVRIKVLTEKGKDLATVSIPYEHGKFEVAAIQGRTIHADGTVIPLKAKPADLLDTKSAGHQFNQMVFILPAVEVGSILEYRLQLRYSEDIVSEPVWILQQPYFVHKAHYFFNPVYNINHEVVDKHNQITEGLGWAFRGEGFQVVHDTLKRYSVDVADIPALPDEDYAPPMDAIRWHVVFYYTNANTTQDFWGTEGKYWAASANRFMGGSGAMKKVVGEIVSGGDSSDQKARKLYAAVMKLENRDFNGAKSALGKPNKDAMGTWKQQGGSSDDLTLLFVALARAAGLNAWPMQVVNRNRSTFDKDNFSSDQLDDYIAIVQVDGKDVYLDPGQKLCAYGSLHWKHESATGFRLTDKGMVLATTPEGPAKATSVERIGDLTFDDQGKVTGTVRLTMTGPQALYWRQISLFKDAKDVSREFVDALNESLPEGVQADLDHFQGLDSAEAELVAFAKVSGTLGTGTAKRLILPGVFFEARSRHPFVEVADRATPIDLHYAVAERDQVTYHLPAGFTLSSNPVPADVDWTGHASMHTRFTQKENDIIATRTFERNSVVLDASDYPGLRYIYRKIATADQQQIVLARPSASEQGN
jgi:hypothetical protein